MSLQPSAKILETLFELIQSRASENRGGGGGRGDSYTKALLQEGTPKVARKVGEEAVEVLVAALAQGEKEFINESADLLYHWLVLCEALHIDPAKTYHVLAERMHDKRNK